MIGSLGEKIKELRESMGISQAELGKLLGVGYVQIGRYETNKLIPPVESIIKLGTHFNYDLLSHIAEYVKQLNEGPNSKERDRPPLQALESLIKDQKELVERMQGLMNKIKQEPLSKPGRSVSLVRQSMNKRDSGAEKP